MKDNLAAKEVYKIFSGDPAGAHSLTTEEKIKIVANKMLEFPQAECSVKHHIGAGVYIRELFIPAGTFIIGHYHKEPHMNHMVSGRVIMLNDDGTTTERKAGAIYVSPQGRKIGLVMEDMIWQNIYPNQNNETDFDVLENMVVSKDGSWEEYEKYQGKLEYMTRHADRDSFNSVEPSKTISDIFECREVFDNYARGSHETKISKSNIQGSGLFCLSPVDAGEFLAPVRMHGKTTTSGKHINHSCAPNARLVLMNDGDIILVSTKRIRGCRGGDSGEEITINYGDDAMLINSRGVLCQ